MPQMANSVQWAEMYNEAKGLTGNGDGGYSSEAIQKYSDGSDPDLYPNVNWLDQMYRNLASSERVTLNLSGGGDIVSIMYQVVFIMKALYLETPGMFMIIILLFIIQNSIFVPIWISPLHRLQHSM